MKKVYSASNLPEAHLLVQLLAHAGIPAHVFNEHAQSGVGEIPFTHAYPEVWIADNHDLARALALVRTHEQSPSPAGSVYCAYCHEENPENFQLCWKCGAGLFPVTK